MKQSLLITCFVGSIVYWHPTEKKESIRWPQTKVQGSGIIKIYPNPSTNGIVTISSTVTERLNFYIFDLEGVLIHQTELKNKQRHVVNNLKKGVYIYEVFQSDVSVEHGKLVVK